MKTRFTSWTNLLVLLALVASLLGFASNASAAPASEGKLPWHFDESYGGFVLDAPQDGSSDVAISEDLAATDAILGAILKNMRSGIPVKFTTTVDGEIIMCVGEVYLDGTLVESKSNCDGKPVKVGKGVIEVKNSTGETGGFRWTVTTNGWHNEDAGTGCPPNDGICWEKSNGLAWTGATDGSADIHQARDAEALQMVRDGATVTIKYTVPGQIVGTCHILIERMDGDDVVESFERHDCAQIDTAVKFPAGTYRFSKSTSEAGGWRLSPWFGYGWRSAQSVPANYNYVVMESLSQAIATAVSNAPATAVPAGTVTAVLTDVGGNNLTFKVSADGTYKLNQEGNNPSDVLSATAVNGVLTFSMKDGNKAFQLQNVPMTSNVAGWSVCPTASDWLCKVEGVTTPSATPSGNGPTATPTSVGAAPATPTASPSGPAAPSEPADFRWLLSVCGSLFILALIIGGIWFAIRRYNATHVAPTITTQPVARTVTEGNPVTFRVVATNGTDYLWTIGGNPITGQTGPTCTFTPTMADNGKEVKVSVSNTHAGPIVSNTALLTVTPAAPTFTGVTPTPVPNGQTTPVKITAVGDHFVNPTPVKVDGVLAPVTDVTWVDAQHIEIMVPAAKFATASSTISIEIAGTTHVVTVS